MDTSTLAISKKLDHDLSPSWLELSERVRALATDLQIKAASTPFSSEAEHLATQTSLLCDHVTTLHSDVIDLIENIETRIPIPCHEPDLSASPPSAPLDPQSIDQEKIRIQREHHELRADFKDILKALFMWRDDPEERLRNRQS